MPDLPQRKKLGIWLYRIMGAMAILGGIYGGATNIMDGPGVISRVLSAGAGAFGGLLLVALLLQVPMIAAEHAGEQHNTALKIAAFVWVLTVVSVMLDLTLTGGFFTIWPLVNMIFGTDMLAFPYGRDSL